MPWIKLQAQVGGEFRAFAAAWRQTDGFGGAEFCMLGVLALVVPILLLVAIVCNWPTLPHEPALQELGLTAMFGLFAVPATAIVAVKLDRISRYRLIDSFAAADDDGE